MRHLFIRSYVRAPIQLNAAGLFNPLYIDCHYLSLLSMIMDNNYIARLISAKSPSICYIDIVILISHILFALGLPLSPGSVNWEFTSAGPIFLLNTNFPPFYLVLHFPTNLSTACCDGQLLRTGS